MTYGKRKDSDQPAQSRNQVRSSVCYFFKNLPCGKPIINMFAHILNAGGHVDQSIGVRRCHELPVLIIRSMFMINEADINNLYTFINKIGDLKWVRY